MHPMRCPTLKIQEIYVPWCVSVYMTGASNYNGCIATLNFINRYVSGALS
jgi:hypothetical protein